MSRGPALLLSLLVLALCFISVPILAATVGGWYAYWGPILLSMIWALVLLWLRTTLFWEEECK
jgi:hypothetical protein